MDWLIWLIMVFIFIILELAAPSMLFFTSLAIGALLAAIVSVLYQGEVFEYIVFAVGAVLSLFTIRPLFKKAMAKTQNLKTNVDALVGKLALVTEDISAFKDGFVKVDGEIWLAESETEIPKGATVQIVSISGTKLKVAK
ncbi:MAG: NfeD family protein [Elusimicrobiota bacterium]|jgi:membrane protein implicated in regulation of membrane protease activity|nr:NfeD family protein [Elusimicrobiota bacterium]